MWRMSAIGKKRTSMNSSCYLVRVLGALFWFAPLQRNRTRSPGRKVGASAVLELKSALHMSDFDPKRT